jgi:hypothetical protein
VFLELRPDGLRDAASGAGESGGNWGRPPYDPNPGAGCWVRGSEAFVGGVARSWGVGYPEPACGPAGEGRVPGTRVVPRAGLVRLIDINRGAIPGLLQRRGQERRGMRGHVFHVCDGAHTFFLDLHLLPAGLAYKIVM